jgi:1-acyl-sn-glycerol-3-phosphate acyltransferase
MKPDVLTAQAVEVVEGRTPWWRIPVAVGRLLRTIVYLLWVAWRMNRGFERLSVPEQQRRIQAWSLRVLHCLGIRMRVQGAFHPGAKLVVANHVSWLDILAINATHPSKFVSKSEVGQWPVVGRMVTLAGTLLLERARRRDAMRVMGLLTSAMREGGTAAVFPEGTTGNGHRLLHFHGNLLQSAIDADVPVQPVAIRYSDQDHAISPQAAYVGDTTLVQSLWWVAGARGLAITLTVLPPQRVTHADRRALAESLSQQIESALR